MRKPHLDLNVQIWYSRGGAIHISSDDPRFVDADGNHKGLNTAISATRQPKTFQLVDALPQREDVQRR